MTNNECRGPFGGLLVIDMMHALNGPFGTRLLCNMGARVIKVEPPGHGDDTHTFGPYMNGQSFYYSFINHGKENMVLDLKSDHDKSIFINMLKQVDVLAENFHPDIMEGLRFSWERLQGINPRLICASLSGFGRTGPLKDTPAYNTVIQAVSGIMIETRYPGAPSVRVGTSLTNLCGGVYLFSRIVSAFYGREESQRGAHIDIATFDAALSFLEHGLMAYIATGKPPQRLGNHHPYMAPFGVFGTQDKPITVCCGNDKLFSASYQALELMGLANDPRSSGNILRVYNQAILKEYIERTLEAQVAEVWLARMHEVGMPVAPLLSVAEAVNLPQTQARNMLVEAGGIMVPGNPIKISGCADPHVMPGATTFNQYGEQIHQEFSS